MDTKLPVFLSFPGKILCQLEGPYDVNQTVILAILVIAFPPKEKHLNWQIGKDSVGEGVLTVFHPIS